MGEYISLKESKYAIGRTQIHKAETVLLAKYLLAVNTKQNLWATVLRNLSSEVMGWLKPNYHGVPGECMKSTFAIEFKTAVNDLNQL